MISIASWVIGPAAKASADANPAVRRAAIRLVGAASRLTANSDVAKVLATALKDEDSSVRLLAAQAMLNMGQPAPELATALSAAVSDPDRSVRVAALMALGSIGPAAKDAMAVVTAALKDTSPDVRIAAANALGAMQTAPAQSQVSLFGGGGDAALRVAAENVWHWAEAGRFDQAKLEADKLLKLGAHPGTVLATFWEVAHARGQELPDWMHRMRNTREMWDLVATLDEAVELANPPKGVASPATTAPGVRSTDPGSGEAGRNPLR
jgi:hypothetical protein